MVFAPRSILCTAIASLSPSNVPDFDGVLADAAVGGDLSGGGHVDEALLAEGRLVAVVAVGPQPGFLVARGILEQE